MTKTLISAVAMFIFAQQPAQMQSECLAMPITRVWTTITPAIVKTRVEPIWPHPGLNDFRGIIIADVWIDERGDVACVKVLGGLIPMNDQAAIGAVRQWKFAPATVGGQPVAVVQEVRIRKTFG